MGFISFHIMPLVITNLGGGHTGTYTQIHTLHRENKFLESRHVLATDQCATGLKTFII